MDSERPGVRAPLWRRARAFWAYERRYAHHARRYLLPVIAGLLFVESAWQVFLAPTDLTRYQCYALTFWFGSTATHWLPAGQCAFLGITPPQPALHMLPLEYPPLTLLAFSLPLLVPIPYYTLGFALLMLLAAAALLWLLQRYASTRAAWLAAWLLLLGTAAVLQVRYDLLPALCTLLCVLAAQRRRWRLAYLALALGTLLKLYPLVGLPALLLAEQQGLRARKSGVRNASAGPSGWSSAILRWQNSLYFLASVVILSLPFALLNAQAAILAPLSYFSQRPAQIESLPSSLLWLLSHFGASIRTSFSYGSLNLLSPASGPLALICNALLAAGLLLILWLQSQGRFDLREAVLASLLVLITTGKVLSPQYLIWVLPLVALCCEGQAARSACGRAWLLCWSTIGLLTTGIYVIFYPHLANPSSAAQIVLTLPGFFEMILARNLLLLAATLALLLQGLRRRPGSYDSYHAEPL